MFTRLFWEDTLERVLATMAQVLLSLWTVDGFDLLSLDFKATAAAVVTAGILAFLKALLAAKAVGDSISPASLAPDNKGVPSR